MTATFFLKGAKVQSSEHMNSGEACTVILLIDCDGSHLSFVVNPHNSADAIAIADAIRAAALAHLPAKDEVPA